MIIRWDQACKLAPAIGHLSSKFEVLKKKTNTINTPFPAAAENFGLFL